MRRIPGLPICRGADDHTGVSWGVEGRLKAVRLPGRCCGGVKTAEKPLSNARVDPHGAPAIFRRLRDLSPLTSRCPCGGIGRRARLKIEFRKECWFDSGQGHQKFPTSNTLLADAAS